MICSANSDIGMKRNVNQDSFVLKTFSDKTALCVVCDGMGGAKGGAEASKIASEAFTRSMEEFLAPFVGKKDKNLHASDIRDNLIISVERANDAVYSYARSHSSLKGMGTTLVAVLVIDHNVFCVNVGDSRMYLIKGNKIKQITKDHSYVQYLLDMGQITEKEAETFPNKNVITRAVGTEDSVTPEYFREGVSEGVFILLCTDGLTNFVDNETIREIVTADSKNMDQLTLGLRVRKLIDTANSNGGADNITAALIKL
ncbi:MAG: Stp1/IreP family PP2C-type Ser/Thr phosphatase [Clostridia bacterium]|nr:Stp1/IreP family PP2C-type Ser/Thr phosphatase [Clostridia bacterium]